MRRRKKPLLPLSLLAPFLALTLVIAPRKRKPLSQLLCAAYKTTWVIIATHFSPGITFAWRRKFNAFLNSHPLFLSAIYYLELILLIFLRDYLLKIQPRSKVVGGGEVYVH